MGHHELPRAPGARRLLNRAVSASAVLAAVAAARPEAGLTAGSSAATRDRVGPPVLDTTEIGEALARGELPLELVAVGAVGALVLGLVLALLVGAIRRRPAERLEDAPAERSGPLPEIPESRVAPPWPMEDANVYPPVSVLDLEAQGAAQPIPATARIDAAEAEAQAAHEAALEVTSGPPEWPSGLDLASGTWQPTHGPSALQLPPPAQADRIEIRGFEDEARHPGLIGGATSALELRESPSSVAVPTPVTPPSRAIAAVDAMSPPRSSLGTPEAPLVVELREESTTRRAGPNLPLMAAVGTVAVGVAFSAGAAVGAALGAGVGAALGLAFAGGAGVAIGAALALLGGRRS